MNYQIIRILTATLFIIFTGCMSGQYFQTAEVAKNSGDTHVGAGITFTTTIATKDDFFDRSFAGFPEVFLRTALVGEFWDFGINSSLLSGIGGDTKFQFYNGEKFDMAIDFGYKYTNYFVAINGEGESQDFYSALLFTFAEEVVVSRITLAPQVVYRRMGDINYKVKPFCLYSDCEERTVVFRAEDYFLGGITLTLGNPHNDKKAQYEQLPGGAMPQVTYLTDFHKRTFVILGIGFVF